MRASTELDNLVDVGINYRNEPDGKDGHFHPEVIGGYDYYDAVFKVGNKFYAGLVNIAVTDRGKLFKDITKIEDITNDIIAQYGKNPQGEFVDKSPINNIPNSKQNVNENSVENINISASKTVDADDGISKVADGEQVKAVSVLQKGEDAVPVQESKDGLIKEKIDLKTPGEIGEKAKPYSKRGIEIEKRLKDYLTNLNENSDYISVPTGTIKKQDLAILTTETGVEFTSLTIGEKSYLIRGMQSGTTIPIELKEAIIKNKGTLDCHSHPFIGDLIPSDEDKDFLKMLTWQKESIIIDPEQSAAKFTIHGIKEKFKIETEQDSDYWKELFKDGD